MKSKILIVDDVDVNREILRTFLKEEYEIIQATGGRQALKLIDEHQDELSAILLDLIMPDMDGYEVMRKLGENGRERLVPILVITSDISIEAEQKSFELGAMDFIRKPYSKELLKRRLENAVYMYERKKSLEGQLEEKYRQMVDLFSQVKRQPEPPRMQSFDLIETLGAFLEYRNASSKNHVKDLKRYIRILGKKYMELYPNGELTKELLHKIVEASPLHDIGNVMIPEAILFKQGKLTPDEYDLVKSHTFRGSEMVQDIPEIYESEYGRQCYEICRYHHERYDGKGYPDKLMGDFIPFSAQLVSIADAYETLINETCYREAIPKDRAQSMILDGACGVFSPRLLESFRQVREELLH